MGSQEAPPTAVKMTALTPKALIHQKFGIKACYRIEEVKESVDGGCPGLVLAQQVKSLYRCSLDLPEISVTSDAFTRKKDAEQAAAKIAVEKLGIQYAKSNPTPQEALNELVARLSGFFTEEFHSSLHPLTGHFRVAMGREDHLSGMIPMSSIAACDPKVNSLCKVINPKADMDPLLVLSLILKAASMSDAIDTTDGELWIRKKGPHSSETLQSLEQCNSDTTEGMCIEAILIPCSIEENEENVQMLTLDLSINQYYMDVIAQKLNVRDSSRIMVSRALGKASSEMKLYFSLPDVYLLSLDSSGDLFENEENNVSMDSILNKQASYLSGQMIYGDAILANVGYKWNSSDLFYEDISLSTYYRMLLSKEPDGHYKLSREAILAAHLPTSFSSRSNWRGPSPRDLLSVFCRQHRLSEPLFSVGSLNSSDNSLEQSERCKRTKLSTRGKGVDKADGGVGDANSCEVKILSRRQDVLLECSFESTYRKESDAIQNAALKVLVWFVEYFKQVDMPMEKVSSFGLSHNIKVHPLSFHREFAAFLSANGVKQNYPLGSIIVDQTIIRQENTTIPFKIEGPDSGVFPSAGSLTCISFAVALVRKGESLKEPLENNDEFEFEVGTGAVIDQLESCVTQLSVDQSAQFITELPSRVVILAAAGESAKRLSKVSLYDHFLEYSIKVLGVTEPLEEKMEQALFSPPLSKQRVEFAVGNINESHATTLVDFGCGSGSLLDSLLDHTTTLKTIVGVDISCKSLARAAKILNSKLSMNSVVRSNIRSAVLYDGSITEFDSRLSEFDIGTCLEVIEHMEEDQAHIFGDVALGLFRPRALIVSTPNYEYNPLLQRSSLPTKEEGDSEEGSAAPSKFRNNDHKFEWTREQFQQWATELAERHRYTVEFGGVGGSGDVEPGFASQIAVFRASEHEQQRGTRVEEPAHCYEVIWEWPNSSNSSL